MKAVSGSNAGMPLVDSNGFALGSFYIIDNQAKQITEQQLSWLRILARQVVKLFEVSKRRSPIVTRQMGSEASIENCLA